MHHEHSIFFGLFNALLSTLFGPVDGAPAWWKNGVDLGSFHIAGIAPRGEHGELLGWIPDHLAMAIVVFLFLALFFLWASRSYRKDAPGPLQNVIEVFVDFLRGVIKENIAHGEHYLPIVGAFFFFIFFCNICSLFFFLQPPTANLNVTFALSVTCFLLLQCGRSQGARPLRVPQALPRADARARAAHVHDRNDREFRSGAFAFRPSLREHLRRAHGKSGVFAGLDSDHRALADDGPGHLRELCLQAYVFTLLTTVYLGGATAHEH